MNDRPTILIVDDLPDARETIIDLLVGEDYILTEADNGTDALTLAAQLIPDLILLDVLMPDMDGFEVCRRLRADPILSGVPIILITSLHDHESRIRGLEVGADDFISKPFDFTELRMRVRVVTRLDRYRRLLLERAKFEWVIEHSDDGYVILSTYDEILYANPQARQYLGLPAISISIDLNNNVNTFTPLPVTDRPISRETFRELARKQYLCEAREAWQNWPKHSPSPGMQRYLVRPESPASGAFWLSVEAAVMPATGSSERYLVCLHNVTERITNQSNLWSFHSLVRHKLRTSLMELSGTLEILNSGVIPLSIEQKESFLSIAIRSTTLLQTQILDIFKYLDAQQLMKYNQGYINIQQITNSLKNIGAELLIPPENLLLKIEGIEDPESISIPLSQPGVELIIWELLENAQKFHPQKSPVIKILIARQGSSNIRIEFHDNGRTLSPDQLLKVWLPYYQAERYFTGQVPGMGLGLSMVATLIWSAGGSCNITNHPKEPGIMVELTLPEYPGILER